MIQQQIAQISPTQSTPASVTKPLFESPMIVYSVHSKNMDALFNDANMNRKFKNTKKPTSNNKKNRKQKVI